MAGFSSLWQYNVLVQQLSYHIPSYVSRVFAMLKANSFRITATGLTGIALTLSFSASSATYKKFYEAKVDLYALEQPDEPVKAQFEFILSDDVKRGEEFRMWLRLNQVAADLEDVIDSMQNNQKYQTQIKSIYDSSDRINSLADSYKEKIIRSIKARTEEKTEALRYAFLAVFFGILEVPYVSSLWMKKEKNNPPGVMV